MSEREASLRAALEALRDQPDALIALIVQQTAAIDELRAQVAQLEARLRDLDEKNRGLREQLHAAQVTAARQAAPFRRALSQRTWEPRRPGRPVGHAGTARGRPDHVDVEIVVPLAQCPICAGPVESVRPIEQYIEDLPERRSHVTHLVTHRGRCRHCARRVASTHPLQISAATGAAATHLGPRAVALAAELNKRLGLTVRGTCRVLHTLGGLRVTPGGLTQALARLADRLRPPYTALQAEIRGSPVVHSDETSWWVGGPGYWLWVVATATTTWYRVVADRSRATFLAMLGPDYPGVLVSDCLIIYEGPGMPVRQQKCYAHHLKAIAAVRAEGPSPYADRWQTLLLAALALKRDAGTAPLDRHTLEHTADAYLAEARLDGAEERLRRRLRRQRAHLFRFLDDAAVPATNNLAERQLRPAVIARKLSCGNKTERGARTWEILASLATTCTQRGESFLDLAAQHLTLAGAR